MVRGDRSRYRSGRPTNQEVPWLPATLRSMEGSTLLTSEGARLCQHWPAQLHKNRFLLLQITQFMIVCYSSPRRLTPQIHACPKTPSCSQELSLVNVSIEHKSGALECGSMLSWCVTLTLVFFNREECLHLKIALDLKLMKMAAIQINWPLQKEKKKTQKQEMLDQHREEVESVFFYTVGGNLK